MRDQHDHGGHGLGDHDVCVSVLAGKDDISIPFRQEIFDKLHVMEDDIVSYSAACMHVSIWRWERRFIKLVVFAEYLTRWDLFGLDELITRMF